MAGSIRGGPVRSAAEHRSAADDAAFRGRNKAPVDAARLNLHSEGVRTDYVQRFLFEELEIRGRLVCLTGAWRRIGTNYLFRGLRACYAFGY